MKSIAMLSAIGLFVGKVEAQEVSGNSPEALPTVVSMTDQAKNDPVRIGRVDTAKIFQFAEVVVTATRSEKDPFDAGRSITLITNREMSNTIYNSVAELLSQQEGLYIAGTGQNPGMLQSIFTRGASNNHTAILVDEVRITDPSTVNNALDLSELSFAGADRIEIVRGAHSTLYGSSAIGGVVNIFTRRNEQPGFHTNVNLSIGTLGKGTSAFTENVFLNYSDPVGFYVNGEIDNSNIKGLDATVDTVTDPSAFKTRDRDDFDKRDIAGKIGFRDDLFDIYASFKNTNHKTDIDKGPFKDDDNSTMKFRRNLWTYGASYRMGDEASLKYVGGYSSMERIGVDDSSIVDGSGNTDHTYSDGTWKATMATNELQANVRLNGLAAVVGGGFYGESMTSQTYFYSRSSFGVYESRTDLDTLNLKASTVSLFAHVDVNGGLVTKDLSPVALALGLRVNDHNAYGTNLTYEIGTTLRVSDRSLLYASYSTGFNAPSLYQLYAPDRNYVSGITRGNGNLRPETSGSFEIGLKQTVANDFNLTVAYFHTVVNNAIEYVYLWDKDIGIDTLGNNWLRDDFRGDTYLNVGKQTTSGIEVVVNSHLNEKLAFSANVSFVSGKLTYDPTNINPSQTGGNHVQLFNNGAFITEEVELLGLVRRPNTANLDMTYTPVEQLALRFDVRYVGSRSDIQYNTELGPYGAQGAVLVADYTVVDLGAKYNLDTHLSFVARVENVFDTKYSEIIGYTTKGRGLYLKMTYSY
jgi:vitamin B12 transporter